MEILLKIATVVVLLLFFTQCSRKKTAAPNLQNWLDSQFPNRFEVITTELDGAIRQMSFKVKKSVVAEKADTMVQSLLRYDLRQPDLNLMTKEVDALFAQAKKEWEDAQVFYKIMKNNGLNDWSVGIHDGKVSALVFEEPTPDLRRQRLFQMEKALADWPAAEGYDKELLLMEPGGLGENGGKTVPLSFWLKWNGQYGKQVIFKIFCPFDRPFKAVDWKDKWEFNADNQRLGEYLDLCRKAANEWALQNLKRPCYLLNTVEFNQKDGSDNLLIFTFSYSWQPVEENDTAEVAGHLVVEFDLDKKVILNIHVLDEQ